MNGLASYFLYGIHNSMNRFIISYFLWRLRNLKQYVSCLRLSPSLTSTEIKNSERRRALKEGKRAHVGDLPAGAEVEGAQAPAVGSQHRQRRVQHAAVRDDELVQARAPREQVAQPGASKKRAGILYLVLTNARDFTAGLFHESTVYDNRPVLPQRANY